MESIFQNDEINVTKTNLDLTIQIRAKEVRTIINIDFNTDSIPIYKLIGKDLGTGVVVDVRPAGVKNRWYFVTISNDNIKKILSECQDIIYCDQEYELCKVKIILMDEKFENFASSTGPLKDVQYEFDFDIKNMNIITS